MRLVVEADSIATKKVSGVGHVTLELLRQFNLMAESDKSFKVIAVVPYGKKHIVQGYSLDNVIIRTLPPGYRYVNYALTRLPITIPIDLLFGPGTYLFPNYKNWSVPFSKSVTFVYDMAYKKFPETMNEKNLAYLELNMTRWLERTKAILTISKSSARDIAVYFPKERHKIRNVYVGIDRSIYHPRTRDESHYQVHKIGLPDKYLLFVSNIEPRKNVLKLLEAYELLPKEISGKYALVLIGADGWKNEQIIEKIKAMKLSGMNVIRPSIYVPDEMMPYIYNGASLLVHPALYEGFGMTLLEALASGTPVLCGNNSSLPEVVGKDALFFEESSAPDIADKITHVLTDVKLSKEMVLSGLERAKMFNWKDVADNIIEAGKVEPL